MLTTSGHLVALLRSRGVVITASSDRIRMRAPRGVVTPTLQTAVRRLKADILSLLAAERATAARPALAPCRGCRQHMQATPEALCSCCWYGLDRSDFPSKLMSIAQELAAKLGPAGRRGARVEQIRAIALERGMHKAVTLLDKKPKWSLVDLHGPDLLLDPDDVVEPGADAGTALLRSKTYGEVWLAYDTTVVNTVAAEEAGREDPRPILYARDIARLRGKPEAAIRAVLETARVWPGARVVS